MYVYYLCIRDLTRRKCVMNKFYTITTIIDLYFRLKLKLLLLLLLAIFSHYATAENYKYYES